MYTRFYSRDDPPPLYYHACGQPVYLKEHTTGHSTFFLTVADGEAVRYCPRCGKRLWVDTLIHPNDMPSLPESDSWLAYLDERDTLRCLEGVL